MTVIFQRCLLCGIEGPRCVATLTSGYHVWHCHRCKFEWIDRNDLSDTCVTDLYEGYPYNKKIDHSFDEMRAHYRLGMLSRMKRYYSQAEIRQLTFLDVGCANGEYLATCVDLGVPTVTGVEVDQTAAQNARKYGLVVENVNLIKSRFDVVQIKNVLTNIPDFSTFLNSCLACLKPGGILFLDVLNHAGLTSRIRKNIYYLGSKSIRYGSVRPPHVINGFCKENVRRILKSRGLHLVQISTGYFGSIHVPYGKLRMSTLIGVVGNVFGMGSMLLVDAIKKSENCQKDI